MESEEIVLSLLDKSVRFFVLPLLRAGVGASLSLVKICDVHAGSRVSDGEPHGDRFNCLVPYCGLTLNWQIFFDLARPHLGPDVIVDGEGSRNDGFQPSLQKCPSLCNWNPADANALLDVVNELLDCYRQHYRQLLTARAPGIASQAEMLADLKFVPQFDAFSFPPALDTATTERAQIAAFTVPLPVDISLLPAYLLPNTPSPAQATLCLSFFEPENNPMVGARLDFSPQLQRAFQGSAQLVMPPWGSEGHSCLHDYVPYVRQLLLDKVEQICESFARRRDFVLAFCSVYGRGLIEFDSESFRRIAFIVISPLTPSTHVLHFIVYVELSGQFPNVCPVFTVQSVYHRTTSDGPVARVFDSGYPYSPRWPGDEMAERARIFLIEKTIQFAKDLMPGSNADPRWTVVC